MVLATFPLRLIAFNQFHLCYPARDPWFQSPREIGNFEKNMTRSCWAPAPDCLSSLKFNFTASLQHRLGFAPWKQAQSSGGRKVKTLSVPPRPIIQWTSLNSADPLEAGARIKMWPKPGDEHSTPPHMNCDRSSEDLSESPLFLPDSSPWVLSNGPFNEQPDGTSLLSYQIIVEIHQSCLLDPFQSPYLDIKTAPKFTPTNGAAITSYILPCDKAFKKWQPHFLHDNLPHQADYPKGIPKNMTSLPPLKTALDPKRTQYRFQPQVQLLRNWHQDLLFSFGPLTCWQDWTEPTSFVHGIEPTCLTLPSISPRCDNECLRMALSL